MQGWESVCWWVLGIPSLEDEKGFLVSWFSFFGCLVFGFLVSRIRDFLVSEFLSFLFPKIQKSFNVFERYLAHITKLPFHVFDWYWSHIQDIQDLLKRIVGGCRCPSFRKFSTNEFPFFCDIYGNNKVKNDPGIFLIFLRCPGVSTDEYNWLFGSGTSSKNPEIIEMRVSGFSHKQAEEL